MRRLPIAIAVALLVALVPGGFASAGGDDEGARRLVATLSGAAEVPGPGDTDGSGSARLWLRPWRQQICFDISVAGITLPAAAAHIHQGAVGVAGGIIVTLAPPSATGRAEGCVSVPRATVRAIMSHPADYYVNVHTSDFANGAVRGQLGQATGSTNQTRTFSTSLRGSAEVPGPGDADGRGTASITINKSLGQVCWSISVSEITLPATAAHIHAGRANVAGPVVVTLSPPGSSGSSSGCVSGVSSALVQAILESPSAYYVNVHTTDFPAGAVRGQLTRNGDGDEDDDDDDDDEGGGDDD